MRTQQEKELVPFSTAVPHVYTEVTGACLSLFEGPVVEALLNEVAHAIADLVTIYGTINEQQPVRPLLVSEVRHGAFQHAGTVVRTSSGIEYRRLYIRRGDVRGAAIVLKKSGAFSASPIR